MNNKFSFFFASLIIISFFFESCSQTATTATVTPVIPSLNQLFSTLRRTPQSLSITAGRDTLVFGNDSTILHFYPGSFQDAGGNAITSGTINLQLLEIYNPGDFVFSRTTTMVNNSLLSSGGAINLSATQNGQAVNAVKYGVAFKQSGASSQAMELYYGNTNNADTITTWTQASGATGTAANTTTDSIAHHYVNSQYYVFDSCSGLGSLSCGFLFTNSSALTGISVIVPNTNYGNVYSEVYLLIPANKIVVPLSAFNSTNLTFSFQTGVQIPVGLNFELVTLTSYNALYYYELTGVTSSGMSVTTTPSLGTFSGVVTAISGL
jgi:hypothetical protein